MAKAKQEETKIENEVVKKDTKPKATKSKSNKAKAKKDEKEVELVNEVIDDEEDDIVEIEEEVVKKDYRQLRKELRAKKFEIDVELLNINSGGTSCRDRSGRVLFDFDSYGEREFISLADVYDIATKYKEFFSKHQIVIIDLDSDDYSIEEVIEFLGLNELYNEIENYDTDYVGQILKLKFKEFEDVVNNSSNDMVRCLASRAVELYNNGKFDSRKKELLLAEKLGLENLFE